MTNTTKASEEAKKSSGDAEKKNAADVSSDED